MSSRNYVESYAYRSSSEPHTAESVDEDPAPPFSPPQNIDLQVFNTEKWNERFQNALKDILTMPTQREKPNLEERIKVWSRMSQIAMDFEYSASTYGRIIIGETFLPYELKTIKPLTHKDGDWGIAGGLKYVVNGILFKYAVDAHGLFFGDNQVAAKIASHDLKSLGYYMWASVPGIHYPMTMIIDYRGFRLTAAAILPINSNTMCYGSSSGTAVILSDEEMAGKLKECAKKLNLKTHLVSESLGNPEKLVPIHSAVDLEGHLGHDGRYYVLDFSRTFPPERPNKQKYPGGHLFRLLRPELVLKWKPLSSDAYSRFTSFSPNKKEDNAEIEEATNYLHSVLIPEFAKKLENMQDKDLLAFKFARYAHMEGINVRHLGKVRQNLKLKNSLCSHLLFIEIAARVIKSRIRRVQEKEMERLHQVQRWNTREAVVAELNSILGQNERSSLFWKTQFKQLISVYFPDALFEEEIESNYDLRHALAEFSLTAPKITETKSPVRALNVLLARIGVICNIRFREESQMTFFQTNVWFDVDNPVDIMDVDEIGARIKHLSILAHSEGTMLRMKAILLKAKKGPEYAKKLIKQSIEKFEDAVDCLPFNHYSIRSLAVLYSCLPESLDTAESFFQQSLAIEPNDGDTLYKYGYFLENLRNKRQEGIQYYLKSIEVQPQHLNCMISLAEAYSHPDVFNKEASTEWYLKAIDLMPSFEKLKLNFTEFQNGGKYCANGTCVTEDISFSLQFQNSHSIDYA